MEHLAVARQVARQAEHLAAVCLVAPRAEQSAAACPAGVYRAEGFLVEGCLAAGFLAVAFPAVVVAMSALVVCRAARVTTAALAPAQALGS